MPTVLQLATNTNPPPINWLLHEIQEQKMRVNEVAARSQLTVPPVHRRAWVELGGFEPPTSSMPWKRATNCAIAPKGSLRVPAAT